MDCCGFRKKFDIDFSDNVLQKDDSSPRLLDLATKMLPYNQWDTGIRQNI